MTQPRMSAAQFRASTKGKPRVAVAPRAERSYGGVVYHSKSEALFAARLELWKLAGIVSAWQRQFPFELHTDGANRREQRYLGRLMVDFAVRLADDSCVFFEVKPPHYLGSHGRISGGTQELSAWKLNHARAQYPERTVIVVSHKRGHWHCWPDTSLEELHALAEAGLVLDSEPEAANARKRTRRR